MTLPDITEQRLTIYFVFTSKKTPMRISDILEEAENMFKSIVHVIYFIYDIRDF
jgi:Fe2+ or Zn2+ uptake regulation protein